jgi:hypothetical protein
MRCDEIQERFVELLYREHGTPSASAELVAHLDSCPACRRELEDLRAVREFLGRWKDEAPLRPVTLPSTPAAPQPVFAVWRSLRYAGVAAMVLLSLLALSNAEISWNEQGFSFRTHLLGPGAAGDAYTKAEMREILRRVRDESEAYMRETNYQMLQTLKDTIDSEHQAEYRQLVSRTSRRQTHN